MQEFHVGDLSYIDQIETFQYQHNPQFDYQEPTKFQRVSDKLKYNKMKRQQIQQNKSEKGRIILQSRQSKLKAAEMKKFQKLLRTKEKLMKKENQAFFKRTCDQFGDTRKSEINNKIMKKGYAYLRNNIKNSSADRLELNKLQQKIKKHYGHKSIDTKQFPTQIKENIDEKYLSQKSKIKKIRHPKLEQIYTPLPQLQKQNDNHPENIQTQITTQRKMNQQQNKLIKIIHKKSIEYTIEPISHFGISLSFRNGYQIIESLKNFIQRNRQQSDLMKFQHYLTNI